MGKIKVKKFVLTISFTSGLLIGILIGSIVFTLLISYRIDNHHKKIAILENTISEKDIKLQKLEESINSQTTVLKGIEIILIFKEEINEIDKITIEKSIKEKYSSLLGKEIKSIDTEILVEVIDKRIFKTDEQEYRLYIDQLILTEILKLYIRIDARN